MKTTILLIALFAILFSVYADNQCQRCETLVHNTRLYCEKERGCTLELYEKFLEPLCDRISEPKEHQHCLNDLEHVPSVWANARTNMTARQVCSAAELCSADHSIDWYLEHSGFSNFVEFKRKYQKKYSSDEEEVMRAKFFLQNLEYIENLNMFAKQRKSSAKFGINKFADLSRTEFKTRVLSKVTAKVDPEAPYAPKYEAEHIEALPSSFDWRTKGAVTPVKNQGQCGSCWSFSATGNMEGQWFLAGHTLVGLSEQNLVDCDHECMMYDGEKSCDAGCNGGLQPNAFTYVIKNGGIDSEASYPYTAENGVCRFNKTNVAATIKNYTMVGKEESQMQAYLVDHGPLAIAADAVEWQFYVGGVFDFPCGTSLDHGILITGYGVEKDVLGTYPFWWIKNSWGADWGDSGYMKLYRGDGLCGCNLFVSSSIVN